MDDPGIDARRHAGALRGLARLNRWSNSAGILWPSLARLSSELGRTVRVLDVASGAGDVPISLRRRAMKAGLHIRVDGCDRSTTAVEFAAAAAARQGADVRFFVHDALRGALPPGYDAVTCSLFLHHLTHEEAVRFLRSAGDAAGTLVAVSDLVRGLPGLALARAATLLLTRSEVVHTDGPRSVRAAFTPAEALSLAREAGLRDARAGRRFPCRFLLEWRKG